MAGSQEITSGLSAKTSFSISDLGPGRVKALKEANNHLTLKYMALECLHKGLEESDNKKAEVINALQQDIEALNDRINNLECTVETLQRHHAHNTERPTGEPTAFGGSPPPISLPREDLINKQYVTVDILGQGGGGHASLLMHRITKKEYVLKRPHRQEDGKHEAEILKMVRHERMADLAEVFQGDFPSDPDWLLLSYCRGGDLSDLHERFQLHKVQIPEVLLWRVFAQIAEGLHWLHHVKLVVHRDLKPGNVLVCEGSSANGLPNFKIADFGLACRVDEVEENHVTGTPQWHPPEADWETEAGDIWSAGAIIHFLALGRPPIKEYCGDPFDARERAEWDATAERIVSPINRREVIASANPSINGNAYAYKTELDYCMRRALDRDPDMRARAAELVNRTAGHAIVESMNADPLPGWVLLKPVTERYLAWQLE